MDDPQNKPPEDPQPRRRIPRYDFEGAIDKQIREAMERGDFDNLKGQGKPLNLARDPGVPEDMELAHNLLKNAGFAPDWIETRQEVETTKAKLLTPLQRFQSDPPRNETDRAYQKAKLIEKFRAGAADLNKLIDTYNLKAPSPQVHLRRIRIDDELEKYFGKSPE